MKRLIIIFLSIFLISTVLASEDEFSYTVDPTFIPYLQHFVEESRETVTYKDFNNLEIKFDKFPKDSRQIGTCQKILWASYVRIRVDWWMEKAGELQREGLVYHELGHCILDRGHMRPHENEIVIYLEKLFLDLKLIKQKKGYLKDYCPSSYMHPSAVSEYCIKKHRSFYIKELFTNTEDNPIIPYTISPHHFPDNYATQKKTALPHHQKCSR